MYICISVIFLIKTSMDIRNNIFTDIPGRNINNIFTDIMQAIEINFGPKDYTFRFCGIILSDEVPNIYFPSGFSKKDIQIRITHNCEYNLKHAVYQVAHEAVHLLSPGLKGTSTYLEEGLATFFAHLYTNKKYGEIHIGDKKYALAADMAKTLLVNNISGIKQMRKKEPNLSQITSQMLVEYYPSLPIELLEALTTNFQEKLPFMDLYYI